MRPYYRMSIDVRKDGIGTNLWGVALGLEGSEEGLFGTENLDGRGWVLGEVRKGSTTLIRYALVWFEVSGPCDSRMRDQPSGDGLSDQSRKVGCDDAHFVDQIPP